MSEKKRVLVVDDNASIRKVIGRILERKGYAVDSAEDGKTALQKIAQNRYDVAIVDRHLPDMQGTDLVGPLSKTQANTVKIMLSGTSTVGTDIKAATLGVDAYLLKPVKPEELLVLIEEKLNSKNPK